MTTIGNLFESATEWLLENMTDERHRLGQMTLIDAFLEWIRRGCLNRTFSVWMCCRYGKCDAIRNMAILALANKLAGQALVIHPWPDLAEQFLEEQRMKDWRQRWLPAGPRLKNIATLHDFGQGSLSNGEWLGSIHIHALLEPMQRALLKQWIESSLNQYGAPPIIFFDEAQHFAMGNKWGRVARDVHAWGCSVVPLTASPFRQDTDDCFGFHVVPKDPDALPKGRTRVYFTRHPDPSKLYQHTENREERTMVIKADTNVPFSQGWTEGHIARATFDLIDWDMKGWGTYTDERLLSTVPQEELGGILPGLYRDPMAIRIAVTKVLKHLETYRTQSVKDATVIWYGMEDMAGGMPGANQKAIRAIFKELDSSIDVRIATLATEGEDDEKSRELIRKFTDSKTKHFDVLLLKSMGALGLDSDRICIVVLWNTTRSLAAMIQMAMRGGNSKLKSHFVIVGLNDVLTTKRLQTFIKDQGGEFTGAEVLDDKVDVVDKNQSPDGGYIPVAPADVGVGDTDGRTCTADEVRLALYCLSIFPMLIGSLTIPQIADKAKQAGMKVPASLSECDFVDSERACDVYRSNLEGKVKAIGKAMFRRRHGRVSTGTPADLAEHGELYKEAAVLIKKRANLWLSWDKNSKERSSNPDDYRKWTAAADALLEEWV
jgi:hypothetical protein